MGKGGENYPCFVIHLALTPEEGEFLGVWLVKSPEDNADYEREWRDAYAELGELEPRRLVDLKADTLERLKSAAGTPSYRTVRDSYQSALEQLAKLSEVARVGQDEAVDDTIQRELAAAGREKTRGLMKMATEHRSVSNLTLRLEIIQDILEMREWALDHSLSGLPVAGWHLVPEPDESGSDREISSPDTADVVASADNIPEEGEASSEGEPEDEEVPTGQKTLLVPPSNPFYSDESPQNKVYSR